MSNRPLTDYFDPDDAIHISGRIFQICKHCGSLVFTFQTVAHAMDHEHLDQVRRKQIKPRVTRPFFG